MGVLIMSRLRLLSIFVIISFCIGHTFAFCMNENGKKPEINTINDLHKFVKEGDAWELRDYGVSDAKVILSKQLDSLKSLFDEGADRTFAESVFKGKITEVVKKFKVFSNDSLDLKAIDFEGVVNAEDFCIDIASNAAMKSYLIKKFFSGEQSTIGAIKEKALKNIRVLKKLKITNLVLNEDLIDPMDVYLISRIKIKKITDKEDKNVFLVRLPCLQQIGGLCHFHAMANSRIFSEKNNLCDIIRALNNSEVFLDEAVKVNDAAVAACWQGAKFEGDQYFRKYSIQLACKQKNKVKFEIKSLVSKVFQSCLDGHVFSLKINETAGEDVVVFYADSEYLVHYFNSDGGLHGYIEKIIKKLRSEDSDSSYGSDSDSDSEDYSSSDSDYSGYYSDSDEDSDEGCNCCISVRKTIKKLWKRVKKIIKGSDYNSDDCAASCWGSDYDSDDYASSEDADYERCEQGPDCWTSDEEDADHERCEQGPDCWTSDEEDFNIEEKSSCLEKTIESLESSEELRVADENGDSDGWEGWPGVRIENLNLEKYGIYKIIIENQANQYGDCPSDIFSTVKIIRDCDGDSFVFFEKNDFEDTLFKDNLAKLVRMITSKFEAQLKKLGAWKKWIAFIKDCGIEVK